MGDILKLYIKTTLRRTPCNHHFRFMKTKKHWANCKITCRAS